MVGAKGCPVGAPGGGAVASFKGALCTGPYAKYFKGAIAVAVAGALAYGIYAYVASTGCPAGVCEVKAASSKPTKKGGKTKRKKRRSASSARLGRTNSSTSSTSTPGKPDETTTPESAPTTPKAEDAAPAAGAADATPAATADSTTTPAVHNVEPTQ